MKFDVKMPEMGESITEGTVAKWLRKPGDKVERDEALLEITTDKIDSEIPSPEKGVLAEILVEEGETVEVGTPLARLETDSEKPTQKTTEKKPVATKVEEKVEEAVSLSPVAKKIADQEGIAVEDLRQIQGSGVKGKLTKEDLLRYVDQVQDKSESKPELARVDVPADDNNYEVIDMSTMRKAIAEHMVQSKRISPHTYTVAEVDMTRIVQFREGIKSKFEKERGFRLTYTPFILHATVLALKAFPLVNSSLEGDRIIQKRFINLGVAVALESGLIVPVIKQADEKNLLGLARSAADLAEKALTKKLMPDDVQGGTFTVTNPGVYGNIFGLPIINQPQLGILGVGAIRKRPVVVGDAIGIRSIMYLSLSYDHRVIDGSLSARFVQQIRSNLENYDTDNAI
jgi:2-oxoglutarate dehydrogenase E2 component (dihydrolipoamide succinyltransferase)